MGYPVNEAELLVEQDAAEISGIKALEDQQKMNAKNTVIMSKTE